jgi:hypothetical protein
MRHGTSRRGVVLIVTVAALLGGCAAPAPPASGPYLGQTPPGSTPKLFAPGIVNRGLATRDASFTPDGNEFYFRVGLPGFSAAAIAVTRRVNGQWQAPELAPFSRDARWRDIEPFVSPNGQRMFFTSDRPVTAGANQPGPFGLWMVDRNGDGWSAPRPLPPHVNAGETFYASVTREGTLYFCRDGDGTGEIWRARPDGDSYGPPEKLGPQVHIGRMRFNPFVAPDESFMIVPAEGLPGAVGGLDYSIVFRRSDDTWSEPLNLGPAVNSPSNGEIAASLSPDGRYLFFASSRIERPAAATRTLADLETRARTAGLNGDNAIYWVEASFLQDLRKKAVWR